MSLLRPTPKDPRAEAEWLYVAAADASAPRLGPLAVAHGRDYVTERFELQPTFKPALEAAAASARPRPAVSPSLKVDLSRWYVGIGPFDISLNWLSRAIAYGELKAGPDTNCLAACVWEAPKLALMVQTRAAACGHLVACAPEALWTPRNRRRRILLRWRVGDARLTRALRELVEEVGEGGPHAAVHPRPAPHHPRAHRPI